MGRRTSDIFVYREQIKRQLCDVRKQKKAENIYVSLFRGLSLKQYEQACQANCVSCHSQPCVQCVAMLSVASVVLEEGFCALSKAFRSAFTQQAYKTDIALRRFLQMPVAAVRIGSPQSGNAAWYLVEFVEGVNYITFAQFAEAIVACRSVKSDKIGLTKAEVKAVLGLASSDRERELIRYSIFKSSTLTSTGA